MCSQVFHITTFTCNLQVNIPEWNLCINVIQSEAHPKCHLYYMNYITGQKNHMHESQIEPSSSNLVIKYLNSRNVPTSCAYMRFDQKEEKCQCIIMMENKHEMKSRSPNQLIYAIKLFEILKALLAVL
jgi:hypothetical protein